MAKTKRQLLFPWFARCNGGVFLATDYAVVEKCPFCGHDGKSEDAEDTYDNAFESGHVRRIWGEEFGIR